jgi:hypothetical protein
MPPTHPRLDRAAAEDAAIDRLLNYTASPAPTRRR